MRSRSIKKTPPRCRRPSSDPTAEPASELSGNAAGELNVRAAAARALLASVADTPFDFREELPSDVGFKAGGRVEGDGGSMGDGLFESGKIRNDGVEGQCTKVFLEPGNRLGRMSLLGSVSAPGWNKTSSPGAVSRSSSRLRLRLACVSQSIASSLVPRSAHTPVRSHVRLADASLEVDDRDRLGSRGCHIGMVAYRPGGPPSSAGDFVGRPAVVELL